MRKEEVFLDLSKLSREEIKEAYKYLIENNQELLFTFVGCVSNGNHFKSEKYLVFCRPSSCSWTCAKDFDDRKEITLQQFKDLFKSYEISQEIEMKKEDIYLDLLTLDRIEIKEIHDILMNNNQSVFHEALKDLALGRLRLNNRYLEFYKNRWVRSCYAPDNSKTEINFQQFKDLFTFKGVTSQDVRNAEEKLFKDLTIGQEIEVNGFVLKVERTTKKWYLFKNKDTDSIAYEYFDSNDLKHYKTEENVKLTEITDKDFINQLEKFSK